MNSPADRPGGVVNVVNTVQAERWNGDSGLHWVANRDRNERRHRPLVRHLLKAAGVAPGEHVLDIGCGCGATTIASARAATAAGSAHGLDLSGPMLAVARQRAAEAAIANITFEHGDAQVHPLRRDHYHLAISSFGVMFFDDPAAAFANVTAALRPDGRLAFLCWQEDKHNELFAIPTQAFPAKVRPPVAAISELFADPGQITELLSGAGCADVQIESIKEPVWMGTDVTDVMDYTRGMRLIRSLAAELGDDARTEQALAAMAQVYATRQRADGVWVNAGAWLVTARRG